MKKKSSLNLDITSHQLYGISCFDKDYRLSYFLNKALGIELKKFDEGLTFLLKGKEYHTSYYYSDEPDFEFFMINNQIQGSYLLPKFKNIDYWLLLKESPNAITSYPIEESFQKIEIINAGFKISTQEDIKVIASIFID